MSGTCKFHPLADLFPLMEGPPYAELVADIKTHGLREPIVIHEHLILDGRNRYRACRTARVEPIYRDYKGDDPRSFVISANIHRRHLTTEQKRGLLKELVKADPTKSNRQIAVEAKVSPTTVGAVRKELEATVQIGRLKKTVGKDGRARPARRARARVTNWTTRVPCVSISRPGTPPAPIISTKARETLTSFGAVISELMRTSRCVSGANGVALIAEHLHDVEFSPDDLCKLAEWLTDFAAQWQKEQHKSEAGNGDTISARTDTGDAP